MTDHDLNHLHPAFKPLAEKFVAAYPSNGVTMRITETWRDPKREDELHAQGITAATGATCKHCFTIDGKPASQAFDFALYDEHGTWITRGSDPRYAQAGAIAKSLGMLWGGGFSHPDYDHIEMKPLAPSTAQA